MEKCVGFKDKRMKSFSYIQDIYDSFSLLHTYTGSSHSIVSLEQNLQLESITPSVILKFRSFFLPI
jgi:hypothetical protein